MEEVLARHRKELKDLQGRITQKKKQATKKSRKGVNDECDRLEFDLKAKHAAEIASLPDREPIDDSDVSTQLETLSVEHNEPEDESNDTKDDQRPVNNTSLDTEESIVPSQVRKPNRAKARLARRAAEQQEVARQAAEEAANLPDMKQQERDRMLENMKERQLSEKVIRADGHCLYSAVADQLSQLGIPLSPDEQPKVLPYQLTRKAAADYIASHEDEFAGFLEEPLQQYVHKIRDTAEWGGQLELQALAKSYGIEINVLQDFGRVEKISPDHGAYSKSIWLGYYKHGFGLGEHYNSLRKAD